MYSWSITLMAVGFIGIILWQGVSWFDVRIRSAITRTFLVEQAQAQVFYGPEDVKAEIHSILRAYNMDIRTAERIIKCESGGRSNAVHHNSNGTSDHGIWQINSVHGYSLKDMHDPVESTYIAVKLYERSGWNPWVCSRKI